MKTLKAVLIATVFSGLCMGKALAASCPQINEFEGLIFDAGAFPASQDMEAYLDNALMSGVEKVVLFPHFAAKQVNSPKALEDVFPDLVLRGYKPWSKAPAVIWPDPLDDLGLLEVELDRFKDRKFLLGNVSRFETKVIRRLVTSYPNLWLGFGAQEVNVLLKACGSGPLAELMSVAPEKVVYASFGLDAQWKNLQKNVTSLKKLGNILTEEQADALLFKNAEELYNIAVNAP